jgi:hypothetical protein
MPDFSMTGVVTPGNADASPSPEQNASDAFTKTAGYMKETGDRAKAAEQASQIEPVFNARTGTWDLGNVPNDALQAILNNAKQFGQIQQIYQKQIDYNQQQQEGLKAHPFQNALAQIAASVGASSKDPLVRGLGDAAQRLNPTLPQLQQQQLQTLQGAERANLGQAGLASQMLARQDTSQYHRDQIEAKAREDRGRIEKDAGISARRGEFDKDTYVQELIAAGEKPERALAAGERLDSVATDAKKRMAAETAKKDQQFNAVQERFEKGLKASAERTDKMIAAAEDRQAKALAHGEAKDAAKETKEKEPSPVLKKQLADLSGADNALDAIEKVLKDPENQKIMGPYAGRAAELGTKLTPGLTDPEGKVKGLIGKLGLQTAQAIKATGAGARGFGPQERPYFEKLAEGIHNTPEQNLKILENWRAFLDQERKGIMVANPKVGWDTTFSPALGPRLGKPAQTETKKYPWEK